MNILNNVKVLDLSRWLPGPFCTMLLGDLGADIIKIEQPGKGDPVRETFPGMYFSTHRNKKSVCVDLGNDAGKEIIYKLAKQSDVVVEGFRPGVIDRLKLGYEDLKKYNDKIIYASISGFGQSGPYRLRSGHDINYLSFAGALSVPTRLDQEPERPGLPVVDLSSGMYAVIAILAAIINRSATGKGQYLDVSMSDVILSWVASRFGDYMLTGKETADDDWEHIMACNDIYHTADGKIAIAAIEQHFWEAFCKAVEREDILEDKRFLTGSDRKKPEHIRLLKEIITKELLKKTTSAWMDIFDEYGVPGSPVNSAAEALADEHFIQRDMIKEVFVPYMKQNLKQISFPVKFSGAKSDEISPPPSVGEHTAAVLENLGYGLDEINDLKEKKIIG